jgi:epoxyqueuosine reductase
MQTNSLVKECAAQLDIDLCRITGNGELTKERKLLEKRSREEYWPQPFANQNIEELTNPALHFPNLKSIIISAVSYNKNGDNPFLSNYVTVEDYHVYLENKLEELAAELQKKLNKNFNYKIYVDKAPFLEKALAQKAGIGFIGKNTLLINPELGSNLFLGEIFTDLKIEKDQPLDLDCGACRLCIDNCQVNALKSEYLLAAEECTAYITQKKGILSESEIKKMGRHIWGCDDCKDVCPYNQQAEKSTVAELMLFDKELEYFLNLERKEIPEELNNTAIIWRGSRILIRNAMLAAANLKEIKYFNLIKEKLNDNSPVIRYYAAYSLLKLDFAKAKRIIEKHIAQENNNGYKNKIMDIFAAEEENHGH